MGSIILDGEVDKHQITHSGVGSILSYDLLTDTTLATLSGVGDAQIYVSDYLNISIEGDGSLYYKGFPTIIQNITGNGQLVDDN